MNRVEDQVLPLIRTEVTGDLLTATADDDLMDIATDPDLLAAGGNAASTSWSRTSRAPILNTGDDHIRLAKICLDVTRRMAQRHVHLALTLPGGKNEILHDCDAAGKTVLIAQPLKDPLRGG